jgi:PAS domain S-box-containing protein
METLKSKISPRTQLLLLMLHKLQAAVEQSLDLVMITDCSGVLEYVNPAFEALTGYSREEVSGQTLDILKPEPQLGEFYQKMWDPVLSGLGPLP